MPARHDLKKRHHGRRKLGQRKRRKLWLHRHKKRFNHPRSKRRTTRQRYLRWRKSRA